MRLIYFVRAFAANLRAELVTRYETRRKAQHKQHWQAAPIGGGGTMQLGYMTEAEALTRLQIMKGDDEPIAFVDFERGFIVFGRQSE